MTINVNISPSARSTARRLVASILVLVLALLGFGHWLGVAMAQGLANSERPMLSQSPPVSGSVGTSTPIPMHLMPPLMVIDNPPVASRPSATASTSRPPWGTTRYAPSARSPQYVASRDTPNNPSGPPTPPRRSALLALLKSPSVPLTASASSSQVPRPSVPMPPRTRIEPPAGAWPPLQVAQRSTDQRDRSAGDSGTSDTETGSDEKQTVGEKPSERATDLLMRDAGVLLPVGTFQYSVDFQYSLNQTDALGLLPDGRPYMQRIQRRRITVPFSLHYGVSKKTEIFASVPFGYSLYKRDAIFGKITDESGVLGDVSFGLTHEMYGGSKKFPALTLTLNASAPTGESTLGSSSGNLAALGSGFWQLGGMFSFVKSHDPVVFFAGVGGGASLPEEIRDVTILPGPSVRGYMGAGMAVNDDISLSASVNASWAIETTLNGIEVPGSDKEAHSFRAGIMRRITPRSRVQTYAQFGMTDDAPTNQFGIQWIHNQ